MRFLLFFCVLVGVLGAAEPRGVEILWDKFGVAHVYAKDAEGLFYGYGYAQLQSHGNLILKLYGESRGRAAEYWGGDANLEADRWVHVNEIPERSAAWYEQQSPEFHRCLEAFAAGMNAYAQRHPEALDPARRVVLPILGVDSLQHVHRIVHFTYMSSMARVAAAAAGGNLSPPGEGDGDAEGHGSNAWAIAPSRTAAGRTLMLMNPHLGWSDWSTYSEVQLVSPELGVNLSGSSQVGFPVLRFLFSDVLGFTQTVNSLDGSDLYKLTLAPDGDGYVFDGAVKSFERRVKSIKVRTADGTLRDEEIVIRKSVHGPVVWDKNGFVLAQRQVALDRPFLLEQYWKMGLAKNFAEYQAQVERLQVPTFNITYADRDGHIMYLYNGTLPKRSMGDLKFWAGVIPGDTSATLWTEIHSYADLPKVIDPPTGWVQNTNDPPWSATYPRTLDPRNFPAYFPGTDFTFRSSRSIQLLHEASRMTLDGLAAYKYSTRLALADRILDDLLAAVEKHGTDLAKQAAQVLAGWDRSAEIESRGAILFEAFAFKFMGPALTGRQNFAVAQDAAEPFTTPRGFKDPAAAAQMLDAAAKEVVARYGALDAPYGQFRRLQIGKTDLPGNGANGGLGSFRVIRYTPVTKDAALQKATFGDSFVAAVEFGPDGPRARVLTSYGASSQPGSPHADDQLKLLSEKRFRPALRTRAEVEANLESRDRL